MTNNFTPFLSWTYPNEVLLERVSIIEELAHFVLEGVYDEYARKPHAKAEPFAHSIKAYMLSAFQPLMKNMPKSWVKSAHEKCGETIAGVVDAFKKAQHVSRYEELLSCPPFRREDLRKHFVMALRAPENEVWKEAEPTVMGAYKKAIENLYQAETRIVTMYAIVQMLRDNEYREINLQGFEEIGQALRLSRATFIRNAAMFGGLLGGEPARFVAQLMARDACHNPVEGGIQYSIIHFLMGDGRLPGSWASATDEKFRKDIKKCYDNLGK